MHVKAVVLFERHWQTAQEFELRAIELAMRPQDGVARVIVHARCVSRHRGGVVIAEQHDGVLRFAQLGDAVDDVNRIGDRGVGGGVNFYSLEKEQMLGRELASEVEHESRLEIVRAGHVGG